MNELIPLELEIVRLLHDGYSKDDIASLTTLTKKGVADRIRNIKRKLEVKTIAQIKSAYKSSLEPSH
jgi:DNA-binding NarL/FixJ family response regulator